jgi:hypothetical protein
MTTDLEIILRFLVFTGRNGSPSIAQPREIGIWAARVLD